jgi:hypothetical protein
MMLWFSIAEVFLRILTEAPVNIFIGGNICKFLHEIATSSRMSFDSICCRKLTVIPTGEILDITSELTEVEDE